MSSWCSDKTHTNLIFVKLSNETIKNQILVKDERESSVAKLYGCPYCSKNLFPHPRPTLPQFFAGQAKSFSMWKIYFRSVAPPMNPILQMRVPFFMGFFSAVAFVWLEVPRGDPRGFLQIVAGLPGVEAIAFDMGSRKHIAGEMQGMELFDWWSFDLI
ncbi:hypothetical protein TNCV_5030621 [Trichonephila clavipes]|nr:hypothetical protein TNCV_5030621 [Trichonephila clavipes]